MEAKYFTELRVLNRDVRRNCNKVRIVLEVYYSVGEEVETWVLSWLKILLMHHEEQFSLHQMTNSKCSTSIMETKKQFDTAQFTLLSLQYPQHQDSRSSADLPIHKSSKPGKTTLVLKRESIYIRGKVFKVVVEERDTSGGKVKGQGTGTELAVDAAMSQEEGVEKRYSRVCTPVINGGGSKEGTEKHRLEDFLYLGVVDDVLV
ncbi:unnamed protein product [Brassica oleracea var. botrytis]|uniref:Uncharacterized protein n=1 Tax=Brassica oleracea TaxID=3712 RepID=A0A3P6BGQ4_BRAOL|nr:unnamed protein product [Brassica oleracea]